MLTDTQYEKVLQEARSTGADFAELFFEDRRDNIIKCVNQTVGGVTSLHIFGVGLYLLQGTASVYVYANDTSYEGLLKLAQTAAGLMQCAGREGAPEQIRFTPQRLPSPCPVKIYPGTVDAGKKVKIIKEMDLAARSAGPSVRALNVEYFDNTQHVTIVNSEGLFAEDERTFTRVRLAGTVAWQDKSCFEFNDFVKPQGFEAFAENDYAGFAQDVIRRMEKRLQAKPMKSCVLPVVFDAGSPGVFWHEACGHNLEAAAGKAGPFYGKKGQMIASEKVTLVDDGCVPGLCGSEAIDDEGQPTRKNVLIDHGRMVLQLADRKGGRELGTGSTGSGRRQSYVYAPVSRMHNTYLDAGEDDDEEMITSLDDGLLVTEVGGGSSGANFSVAVKYGYRIRSGKLAEPVSGIVLSGTSTELIRRVDRVGKTLKKDLGGGFCGAASGLVQTTAYEPRFRVSSMNVGGV